MSEFEYLLIVVALLLSFAIARLIGGVSSVFARSSRYWIHACWVAGTIANITLSWWIIYMYRDVQWTFWFFALWLFPTVLLLYVAYQLVPEEARAVESWREHFFLVRRRIMGANIGFALGVATFNLLVLGSPSPDRILGPLPSLALLVVGYRFENERIQGAVAVLYVLGVLGLTFVFNTR